MTSALSNMGRQGLSSRHQPPSDFVEPDELRTSFALAMSQMYRNEVPLYGDLIRIVQDVNHSVITAQGRDGAVRSSAELERLTLERHGAIRLGTPEELLTVKRIFALLGMQAVGYYDLSVAGLPMHATCFRPVSTISLARNPFRVFTTLLRPELVQSDNARDLALQLLEKRQIFSQDLLRILDVAETQNLRLTSDQAATLIREALYTFSWKPVAAATYAEYQILRAEHPILADIACFNSAHINHLTPRTLDIGAAQIAMQKEDMDTKDRIEGPPIRACPILLRQTSFLALEEAIRFKTDDAGERLTSGSHKARFGEIEERGAAVTPAGRDLYDRLFSEAMSAARGLSPEAADAILAKAFQRYPDTWKELRQRELVYCEYRCTGKALSPSLESGEISESLVERLVEQGVLEAVPITYEDFLPFSAAGIFQSNLKGNAPKAKLEQEVPQPCPDLPGMEKALGGSVLDPDDLYSTAQRESLISCARKLRA
ncbi:uncharacterized protein E0L32_008929 [Thyridium curvatum]|uniref:2-oxoadipate dioxygenase/decarboxylase n=1 Tax=Thyridium curvatum TaxID=1093900 RepID=A0A507AR40_9PEZI|nr:uncharacterized protein E0L32_008929 [Thyridium curvatum]TPX09907.1 hypothetical protein E0L32_008929 [Thyridium curvatum]